MHELGQPAFLVVLILTIIFLANKILFQPPRVRLGLTQLRVLISFCRHHRICSWLLAPYLDCLCGYALASPEPGNLLPSTRTNSALAHVHAAGTRTLPRPRIPSCRSRHLGPFLRERDVPGAYRICKQVRPAVIVLSATAR